MYPPAPQYAPLEDLQGFFLNYLIRKAGIENPDAVKFALSESGIVANVYSAVSSEISDAQRETLQASYGRNHAFIDLAKMEKNIAQRRGAEYLQRAKDLLNIFANNGGRDKQGNFNQARAIEEIDHYWQQTAEQAEQAWKEWLTAAVKRAETNMPVKLAQSSPPPEHPEQLASPGFIIPPVPSGPRTK